MTAAPLPVDESGRLKTLSALDVLDTPPDPVLDGLVRSAARALACPVALVSLVDADRQWFKAACGLDTRETPRGPAFCAHAILSDAPLVVPDALLDERFADNPLVTGPPHVRAYAGVPLAVDGHRLGTLCVIDHAPHPFDAAALALLQDLVGAVVHWLQARQVQVALVERERDLRDLAAQVPGVVYRAALDPGSSTLYVSPRLADLGHDPAVWMARPGAWLEALHPDDRLSTLRSLHASVHDGQAVSLNYRLADGQGGWRHILDRARVMPATGNGSPQLLGVMVDQTQAIESRRWQQRLLAAVEQASEAIVITDLDGRIEYVNRSACEVSGHTHDELLGANARVFKSALTPPAVHAAMWAALRRGEVWRGFLHNQRKDGRPCVECATLRPVFGDDGQPTDYLAVKQDVTEQRRLHEELDRYRDRLEDLVAQRTAELERAREAAEAASAAKSAFLATMSHEIRTPMNGVVGIVEVLQQTALSAYQRELTDTIAESGAVLLALIDDILDFSKIEAGRIVLADAPMDVRGLAESAADALLPLAARDGVDLHLFVDPALPARLRGDALRLRQIMTNLLGNVIKFSSGLQRTGRVAMRLTRRPAGGLVLQVRDNGVGLDAPTRARLFQPFEQGSAPGAQRPGGTGLGLAISQRLARAMGGGITVDDGQPEGCCFQVELPLRAAPATPAPVLQPLAGLRVQLDLDGLAPDGARDHEREADWACHLRAAGATMVARHADVQVLAHGLADPEGAQAQVRVRHGQRRQPRAQRPGRIDLDLQVLHADALVGAVAMAAGRFAPGVPGRATRLETSPHADPASAARSGRLVLVAEDNPINRRVVQHQLHRLGIAAEIVDDGAQALARWRAAPGHYGLLLTDLHMPGLDGWALSAAIRAAESSRPPGSAAPRLPIVALTAQALSDEAERCLAAGMDGHLSKPVHLSALQAVLTRWLLPVDAASGDTPGAAPAPAGFDDSALARLVDGDADTLDSLRAAFVKDGGQTFEAIEAALADGDGPALASLAHRWKSSSRAVGALALGDGLESLEAAGRDARRADWPAQVATIGAEWSRVRRRLSPVGPAVACHQVWLLDDDATQRLILERMVGVVAETPVRCFADAVDLLAALTAARDTEDLTGLLVLLDLQLPGMDGVELIRHLSRRGFTGSLALVSGADRRVLEAAERLALACRLRVLGRLHKPVDGASLRALLIHWRAGDGAPAPRPRARSYPPHELRRALTQGELVLHYQPQVDVHDGTLIGVEALVRWQHPQDGLVGPDAFVPMAESSGLALALTTCVLDLALTQLGQWQRDAGLRPRVAVNVSMADLTRLDFPELVSAALVAHGLQPADLSIEITERQLMQDVRATLDVLARLRLRGIGLSIDDFGTGHASLAQLRDLPVDELKVDRGFVHGARQHATLRAILAGSVEMAHALGLQVVAEGVEDLDDWQLLQEMGVRVAQGWYVARPMPGDALPGWCATWLAARPHAGLPADAGSDSAGTP